MKKTFVQTVASWFKVENPDEATEPEVAALMAELGDDVDAIKTATLESTATDFTDEIKAVETSVTNLESRIGELETAVNGTGEDAAEDAKVAGLSAEIAEVRDLVTALQTSVKDFGAQLATLSKTVATVKATGISKPETGGKPAAAVEDDGNTEMKVVSAPGLTDLLNKAKAVKVN